ncbi:hypothetical protein H4R34_000373 [Dimargaris verticillata]|uniref:Metal-dependent protein hydrolase n=1 Tax=Dimargaris verticillata TaxID=2761393 RepID=A0A9W8EFG7_9FUNG|nr:hypothetical protein H4R34_000373 [Dimargaris verticillata]
MARKLIGTHNGTFHCDEALAVYLLGRTREFGDNDLVRTRDPAVLSTCDIVVDVGGVYDHAQCRYDHHQRGFSEVFSPKYTTKLSSAGLIYKHYGKEIIARELRQDDDDIQAPESATIELLYDKLYEEFIEALDAIDNGISRYPAEVEPRYKDNTNLPSRVGRLNPWWNQPDVDLDARFLQAVKMTGEEFSQRVQYYGRAWLPAYALVEEAVKTRTQADPSGQIIVLNTPCPWKDHIYAVEGKQQVSPPILYVLYPDTTNNQWRVQCVPVESGSFDSRKGLPEVWRGYRDDELSQRVGSDGCVFVHASGFIGGHRSQNGALAMARKAIEL